MKCRIRRHGQSPENRRSREGAWIEISAKIEDAEAYINVAPVRERGLKWHICVFAVALDVAPVRERGLKYRRNQTQCKGCVGRSREGAWIEIVALVPNSAMAHGRSREGAWIEIQHRRRCSQSTTSRSREGAWIEMACAWSWLTRRRCRSREGAWIEM